MVWAIRIISGLAVMTAPYIWTVGQAGLETANKNICELASALITLPTCKIHFVYFGLWGIGLAAAILFIAFDIAHFVRRTATPYGGVMLFCRHYQTAVVRSIKNTGAKLEPSHIIILGLVIAVVGVVWQQYRGPIIIKGIEIGSPALTQNPPKPPLTPEQITQVTAPLQAEIKSLKLRLAEADPVQSIKTIDQTNTLQWRPKLKPPYDDDAFNRMFMMTGRLTDLLLGPAEDAYNSTYNVLTGWRGIQTRSGIRRSARETSRDKQQSELNYE
jgi:hypothetical protein